MYERLDECPACKGTEFKNHLICKDTLVSQESFAIVKCKDCKILFTNPRPDAASLPAYYQSDDYISHTNKGNNLINLIYKIVRNFTIRSKYSIITQKIKNGKILDVGCGTGDFLHYCQKKSWEVTGVETNPIARELTKEKGIKNIYSSYQEIEENETFDVITLWHVLEHIPDLTEAINTFKKSLKKDGLLVIALPNRDSLDALVYNENWAAYDVPRHLYHFNQESFGKLMKKNKLKIIQIQPMKWDAFYISLLSEKIQHNKINYLKAIKQGWDSNKWAEKNNGNYSSLTYIVQK
jgi:2-polyprenyl-3-methyl-5-hydroxy-6-metoxy-1,4-benzoquinol methylase